MNENNEIFESESGIIVDIPSTTNFSDLLKRLEDNVAHIKHTINIGKQNAQNMGTNTERGVFDDLELGLYDFEHSYNALMNYFRDPPTEEEKSIINKNASMKQILDNFREFSAQIQQISLDDRLQEYNKQIISFCDIVENKLSHNAGEYDKFLDDFIEKEKNKMSKFSEIFNAMISNTRLFFISIVALCIILGVGLGAILLFTYLKWQDYKSINEKISIITQGVASISADDKDKSLTLSFAKNKKTILIKEDKNSVHITLQGGE